MIRRNEILKFRKFIIYTFIVTSTINVSFSQDSNVIQKKIIEGKWCWKDSVGTYLEYLPNGEVRDIECSEDITDPNDGPIKYRLEEKNDTLFLIHHYKQMIVNNKSISGYENRWAVRISGDYMERISFKRGKGIDNHIDEYDVRIKITNNTSRIIDTNRLITKYILPKGFRGHVTIAFNQSNGVAPEYDSQGNSIVRIPPCGILKTQMKEDAFGIAGGRFSVLIVDSLSQSLIMLPTYDKFENPHRRESLKNTFGIVMYGFNQLARKDVNRLFGEPIVGNTLMFFVGVYGNIGRLKIGEAWF